MTSAMTLWSEQWCMLQWLVNLNSGLRPKLRCLVSVFGLSKRLIQKVIWPIVWPTSARFTSWLLLLDCSAVRHSAIRSQQPLDRPVWSHVDCFSQCDLMVHEFSRLDLHTTRPPQFLLPPGGTVFIVIKALHTFSCSMKIWQKILAHTQVYTVTFYCMSCLAVCTVCQSK